MIGSIDTHRVSAPSIPSEKVEVKIEEEREESSDDMGFGLFD